MKQILSYGFILALCISCGAAKNSDRKGNQPEGTRGGEFSTNPDDQNFQKYAFSQAYRNQENIRLTYTDMVRALQETKPDLPGTTFLIPDIEVHIDSNVKGPAKISYTVSECGNSVAATVTLADRIKDCKDKVPDANSLTWNGKKSGINGEGDWELISYSAGKKVWQDKRTGLLWSDVVATADYEVATGIKLGNTNNFKDRICQVLEDAPRDALGKIHTSKVNWRLPNRNEFLQADINGGRFVLPNSDDEQLWTSSYAGNDEAWSIIQKTGELKKVNITTTLKVRCIGVPL